ncbi:MAG: hypothetical protein ACKV1O_02465 [Saprospiraceae bacterium]
MGELKKPLLNLAPPPDGEPKRVPCETGDMPLHYFTVDAETKILGGAWPATGEIPVAIAEEQVRINHYHLKLEERNGIKLLLCGATDTWEAYNNLNNCLMLMLMQSTADLPKWVAELSKLTADSPKTFGEIADKIKKVYDQICVVEKAYCALKQCIDKVCNETDKKKIEAELEEYLPKIGLAVKILVKQGAQAVTSVVQAASIYAQTNLVGFEALIAALKAPAEQLKKDNDSAVEAAAKQMAEWQKKYQEAIIAITVSKGDFGKAATLKRGREVAYCFLNKEAGPLQSYQDELLGLFDPDKKMSGKTKSGSKTSGKTGN